MEEIKTELKKSLTNIIDEEYKIINPVEENRTQEEKDKLQELVNYH